MSIFADLFRRGRGLAVGCVSRGEKRRMKKYTGWFIVFPSSFALEAPPLYRNFIRLFLEHSFTAIYFHVNDAPLYFFNTDCNARTTQQLVVEKLVAQYSNHKIVIEKKKLLSFKSLVNNGIQTILIFEKNSLKSRIGFIYLF